MSNVVSWFFDSSLYVKGTPANATLITSYISVAFILCLLQLNCTKLLINRMNSVCKHPAYIGYLCYHTQKLHTARNTVQKLSEFITFPHIKIKIKLS